MGQGPSQGEGPSTFLKPDLLKDLTVAAGALVFVAVVAGDQGPHLRQQSSLGGPEPHSALQGEHGH